MQHISRRAAIVGLASCGLFAKQASAIGATLIRVYRDPDCGCCSGWVRHLEENGFTADVHDDRALPTLREKAGVPLHLVGCHAAEVEGYIIEGHVPAAAIRRLLQERPKAIGLSVPGMPTGSPGMDGPPVRYAAILFGDGLEQTFMQFEGSRRVE
ncbi:hypothetical protein V1291_004510 [Nitrobacteraceae bacterium AZCC 1564]